MSEENEIETHVHLFWSAEVKKLLIKINPRLGDAYDVAWNPINYGIIGGIGVIINYAVQFALMSFMPWYVTNALAIICAWVWNWQNATGAWAYRWGFREAPPPKTETKQKKKWFFF